MLEIHRLQVRQGFQKCWKWKLTLYLKGLADLCTHFAHASVVTTMTSLWALWRLKSPASQLFTQRFIQAQIKENIKASRHWPLWWEFTGDRWMVNSPLKGPETRKMLPYDDVIMVIYWMIDFSHTLVLLVEQQLRPQLHKCAEDRPEKDSR